MDELKRKLISNLQGYLRERQDFIASIPTMDPIWAAPFDIIGNIFEPILGSVDSKCPNLFLLLDNIVRSENIRAGAIQFVIKIIKRESTAEWHSKFEFSNGNVLYKFEKVSGQDIDTKVAIYLGTSGCQAFYSIIENILRNTTRHSKKEKLFKVKTFSDCILYLKAKDTNDKDKILESLRQNEILKKSLFNELGQNEKNNIDAIDRKITKLLAQEEKKKEEDIILCPLKITIEFHINDNENKYQDDYILVKIYDNMGGWEKLNDKIWVMKNEEGKLKCAVLNENLKEVEIREALMPIIKEYEEIKKLRGEEKNKKIEEELNRIIFDRKFNPEYEEGKIIDETGKVKEGAWGLKEMRICASLLRGLKITDYETPLPKDEPPILDPYVEPDMNNFQEGSLGYKFYLPKVKDLLIISTELANNNEIKISELKNQGIYIESDINKITELQNRGKFTHEFVVIDVDENNNVYFLKNNILKLPYKLFFITKNGNLPDDVLKTIKKIRWDLSNGDGDINKLKHLTINKNELAQWLKNDNQSFEINRDNYNFRSHEKTILEIKKRWAQYLLNNTGDLPKVALWPSETDNVWQDEVFKNSIIGGGTEEPSTNNNDWKVLEDLAKKSSKSILFAHRFGNIDERNDIYKLFIDNNPLCIFPFTRQGADPIIGLCNILQQDDKFQKINAYFNSVEAGLLNCIIIDERIFNEFSNEKFIAQVKIELGRAWFLQNVVAFNLERDTLGKFLLWGYKIDPHNLERVMKVEKINNDLESFLPAHFKSKLHFLIVHQTIVTKIGGKDALKEFINQIPKDYKPWYIVITSGRGHPSSEEMPENTKFYDFSNLRNCLIEYPDKTLLTKNLSQVKDDKGVLK